MAGSDTFSTFIDPSTVPAAVATGICTAQTTGGGANLTLNGSLVSTGVATLTPARNVVISTVSANASVNFAVTGTLADGLTVFTETIAGPDTGGGIVSTTSLFATVTQVAVDAAITGNATVGSGATVIAPVFAGRTRIRGIYFVNTGTAGILNFTNGVTGNGASILKFITSGGATSADYPDIPDEGLLFKDGAYLVYPTTATTGVTVFFN